MSDLDAAAHRGARFHVAAVAVAILLALAETWPLVTVLGTHYPMRARRPSPDGASSDQSSPT